MVGLGWGASLLLTSANALRALSCLESRCIMRNIWSTTGYEDQSLHSYLSLRLQVKTSPSICAPRLELFCLVPTTITIIIMHDNCRQWPSIIPRGRNVLQDRIFLHLDASTDSEVGGDKNFSSGSSRSQDADFWRCRAWHTISRRLWQGGRRFV